MGEAPVKIHTLSQCLLRRFADSEGRIVRHDLATGASRIAQPGREGFRRNLWTKATAREMELLWSRQAETDVADVFEKLDRRQALKTRDKFLLARFCAIHFVRSEEFIKIYQRLLRRKSSMEFMDKDLDFAIQFRVKYEVLRRMGIPSKFFENNVREYYFKSAEYLRGYGIEIGVAAGSARFILPDSGFVVSDIRSGTYQPSGGVALMQARQGVLPLSPTRVLAFKKGARGIKYRQLNDEQVELMNNHLKKGSSKGYYTQP